MLVVLVLTALTLVVYGQPPELVCYNPPLPTGDVIAARSDPTLLQPLLERASELMEPQLEGLSIEEAAAIVPEILNQTSFTMFQEVLATDPENFNPVDLTIVTLQSLLNTSNGVEIFNTALQDPLNFVHSFTLIISNFDLDCMDDPTAFFRFLLISMLFELLQEPFRDSFVDVLNTTAVIVTKQQNLTERVVSYLEPLIENLNQAENFEQVLGSFSSEDTVTVAVWSAMESSELVLQPEQVSADVTAFFKQVQESFGFDEKNFVRFLNDIFQGILEALT